MKVYIVRIGHQIKVFASRDAAQTYIDPIINEYRKYSKMLGPYDNIPKLTEHDLEAAEFLEKAKQIYERLLLLKTHVSHVYFNELEDLI